jgi:hypothetical protein
MLVGNLDAIAPPTITCVDNSLSKKHGSSWAVYMSSDML